jgi:hypothetical protein
MSTTLTPANLIRSDFFWLGIILKKENPGIFQTLKEKYLTHSLATVEKKQHSPGEVEKYLNTIEKVFDLPEGSINLIASEEPAKGPIAGHPIVVVRQAAIYHFMSHTTLTQEKVAHHFGLANQSCVCAALKASKGYIKIKDEIFLKYYGIIKSIEV